jgi:hypothetical protein
MMKLANYLLELCRYERCLLVPRCTAIFSAGRALRKAARTHIHSATLCFPRGLTKHDLIAPIMNLPDYMRMFASVCQLRRSYRKVDCWVRLQPSVKDA